MEQMLFKQLRSNVIGSLHGKILEVGVGTGKNLPYYLPGSHVLGIDISPKMLRRASQKKSSFRGSKIELKIMNAQKLKLEDESFDIVVCTFVLCSVPDPIQAIQEMLRILKPNGHLILLEHVLSKISLLTLLQRLINPFTKGILGYNIDRDTVSNLEKGKAFILKDQNLTKTDILKLIICKKPENIF